MGRLTLYQVGALIKGTKVNISYLFRDEDLGNGGQAIESSLDITFLLDYVTSTLKINK